MHSPSPLPIPGCKGQISSRGWGAVVKLPLHNNGHSHDPFFPCLFVIWEPHSHSSGYLTWSCFPPSLSSVLCPVFPSLITVTYNSDGLQILIDILGALQLLECIELWNWLAFVELELLTLPTLPVEPHRKGSTCTLSLGVTSSIMEETWFKLIWQQECDCHKPRVWRVWKWDFSEDLSSYRLSYMSSYIPDSSLGLLQ